MPLPSLNTDQINALIRDSEGRAVSYVDSPDWYCGERKSTHMGRDGVQPACYGDCGTCSSLAYSLRDHCERYLRAQDDARFLRAKWEELDAEYETESSRKTPRKNRLKSLAWELSVTRQDIDGCERTMRELRAKYFRGYEGRLLIQ